MYKILIADDEKWIRKGIIARLKKYGFHFSWIGQAGDGVEALDKIRDNDPEIVLVDIKMDRMDGIELMRRAREISKDIKFLVITGYAEFEFAEQAINYGARGYILKPIEAQHFVRLLQSVIIELDQELRSPGIVIDSLKGINQSPELLLEASFNQALKSLPDYSHESINLPPIPGITDAHNYALGLIHVDSVNYKNRMCTGSAKESIKGFIKNELDQVFKNHSVYLFNDGKDDSNLIFLITHKDTGRLQLLLRKISFLSLMKVKNAGYSISIGTSSVHNNLTRSLYQQAREALNLRLIQSRGMIYHFDDIKANNTLNTNESDLKLLEGYIKHFDLKGLESLLVEIFSPPKKDILSIDYLRYAYFSIIHVLTRCLTELNIGLMNLDELLFSEDIFNYFDSAENIGKYLFSVIRDALRRFNGAVNAEYGKIDEIRDYIDSNYAGNIYTELIAREFSMNPNYLSTLFKQKTGLTVTQYITQLRINATCRLLKQTHLQVWKIAELVGYSDAVYFHKVFKKTKGLTPGSFRHGS